MMIDIAMQARDYRRRLGFSSQGAVKDFLGAKNITPTVDLAYIELLNTRLFELVTSLNGAVSPDIRHSDLEAFRQEYIIQPHRIMLEHNILPRLNNQGRRPEQVYYSWMRGFVLANYFLKALGVIFGVDVSHIRIIGDDDLANIELFKRTPKADIEVVLRDGSLLRIEMQTGFTGINDIKKHKVVEAKRLFLEERIPTLAIHFDLYNGQAAFIRLDTIEDTNTNWEARQQMEGQIVFTIDQSYFCWNITEPPITYESLHL